ncbi:MAG: peptidoglycan-binding protein [Oscillospiraceae bacterium]|nr:peptidoglycan-binding protein [Oscillospiraceae bacterium]
MAKKRIISLLLALLTVLSLLPSVRVDAASMKQGSRGSNVKQLQQNLIGMGYLDGTADGSYGAKTKAAVKEFQRDFGLSTDGNAGEATQSALRSAVVRLQVELKAAGYAPGSADGSFGTKTKKALQAYQVDNKLAKTGEADAATWAAINRTTAGMKISALKKGSSGTQVKYLQRALIGLGYLNGTADGQYGSKTAEAVRDYQRAYGLGVDGSAGKNTMTSIKNTIVALQSDLTRKGYDANGTDGVFGGGTKSAVQAYQRAVGITVTGIAGAKTMKKLYGYSLGGNETSGGGEKSWKTWIEPLYQDKDTSKFWYNNRTQWRTVETSGCAGVSVAMAVNALLGTQKHTGKSVMQWYADHGYYLGSGTYHNGLLKFPRTLGLNTTLTGNRNKVIEHLKKDRLAVVLIKDKTGEALLTYKGGGGHYILLSGYRVTDGEDQVYVNNPLSYKKSGWFDLDDVMANAIIREGLREPFVVIYK